MFAITAAGSVAGALATPRLIRSLAPRLIVTAALWAVAVAMILLLAVRSPYLIGLLGAFSVFFAPALGSLLFASIAAEAPDHLQGRTTAGAIQISSLPAPLAPLLAGVLLGALGVRHTVLVYAIFLLALAAGATVSRGLRAAH
jgi:hypothetical protein